MGTLKLSNSSGNFVALTPPSSIASDVTLTLPNTDGDSGQVLSTNGSGALSFAAPGKILQVVSTTKTDTFTTTNTAYTDVTDLSVSITPASTSNKILVFGHIHAGASADVFIVAQIVRDSTAIGIADADGSRRQASVGRFLGTATNGGGTHITLPFSHLDSPSTTSATTYKIQIGSNAAGTLCVNRGSSDGDSASTYRATSSITVMEVAA